MTDEELKAIETTLNETAYRCVESREDCEAHQLDRAAWALLAEVRRLKTNPGCPTCGHRHRPYLTGFNTVSKPVSKC